MFVGYQSFVDFSAQVNHKHKTLVKLQFQSCTWITFTIWWAVAAKGLFAIKLYMRELTVRLCFVKPYSLPRDKSQNTIKWNIMNKVKHFKWINVNVQYTFSTKFVMRRWYTWNTIRLKLIIVASQNLQIQYIGLF